MIPKPLHVQVAEALGDAIVDHEWFFESHAYCSGPCKQPWDSRRPGRCAKHYDTDWSATGPLIEKYSITIWPVLKPNPREGLSGWSADLGSYGDGYNGLSVGGTTPLIAVCNLLLELQRVGKL